MSSAFQAFVPSRLRRNPKIESFPSLFRPWHVSSSTFRKLEFRGTLFFSLLLLLLLLLILFFFFCLFFFSSSASSSSSRLHPPGRVSRDFTSFSATDCESTNAWLVISWEIHGQPVPRKSWRQLGRDCRSNAIKVTVAGWSFRLASPSHLSVRSYYAHLRNRAR